MDSDFDNNKMQAFEQWLDNFTREEVLIANRLVADKVYSLCNDDVSLRSTKEQNGEYGNEKPSKLVYSPEEVMEVLGISRSGVYAAIHRGDIPYVRVGRRVLIPKEELNKRLTSPPTVALPNENHT